MKTVLLIDVAHLWWTHYHATVDRPVSEAYERTIAHVYDLAGKREHVAICADSPPYFRSETFPAYKAHRARPEPVVVEQFRRVRERLALDGYPLLSHPGYEADDIIAGAVGWLATQDGFPDELRVVIASNDKDLLQLVTDGVVMHSTRTGDTIDAEGVKAKFGVYPEQMRDLLALWGDKADGIPGVPGVGQVKAAKLLQQFTTLDAAIAQLDAVEPKSLRDAIREHMTALDLSRRLITLRPDAPIDYAAIFAPRETQPVTDFQDASFEDIDETKESDVSAAPKPEPPSQPEATEQRAKPLPPNGSTALAVVPQNFEQGLQPATLGSAYKLAKGLYESRLYNRFPNPEAIWAVIIRGREMGLGALTALDSFHIIEGKPAPAAHLLVSRAKQHPDCEFFRYVGGDDTYAEYETKHRSEPEPTRLRYTYAQAERAGITKSQKGRTNWEKRPDEMLRKTCAVQLARIVYPETMQGLYAEEELGA